MAKIGREKRGERWPIHLLARLETKNVVPLVFIFASCLLSFLPGLSSSWLFIIFLYLFYFVIVTSILSGSVSPRAMFEKEFRIANYIFATFCLWFWIWAIGDARDYYRVEHQIATLAERFNTGDDQAAVNLAEYLDALTTKDIGNKHSLYQMKSERVKWLEKYATRRVGKDSEADVDLLLELGHYFIRGRYGQWFTNEEQTVKGTNYYRRADKLGSAEALIAMNRDLVEAAKARLQNQIRLEKREQQNQIEAEKRRLQRIQDSKKSAAEMAGEYYGSARNGIDKAWARITEPARSLARDFEKGSSGVK